MSVPFLRTPGAVQWTAAAAFVVLGAGAWLLLGRGSGGGGKAATVAGPGFREVARESGIQFRMDFLPNEQGEKFKINLYDHGTGVAVADVNGDGYDDVYFLNQLGSNALYVNDGKGRFRDVTAKAGVAMPDVISMAAAFADVDGDGDQDLYVTTTRGGNVFFRNRGDGTFEDATKEAGLSLVAHSEQGAFFDPDRDGDLDLLVTNTAKWTTDEFDESAKYYVGLPSLERLLDSPKEQNRYYKNDGKGRFEDATAESGLAGVGWGGDVAVFDCDEDGDLDVFIGHMFGRSALYENDGQGRFRDVTARALGSTSWGTVGAKAFDFDGDGLLDLFLVDMHSDMWMDARTDPATLDVHRKFPGPYGSLVEEGRMTRAEERDRIERRGYPVEGLIYGNTLFHNLGGGRFEEVSDQAGVETLWPWGIATADFDGDGDEDAFLPSGMGYPYEYVPSPFLVNQGDGTFVDGAKSAGLDPPPGGPFLGFELGGRRATRSYRSAATADFDGDGRVDIVANNFNDRAFLFQNAWPRRHYAAFRLTGTASNRDAIGALVKLTVGGRVFVRQVNAAGGYLAQSSKTLHFGLGDATKIDRCEIRWPSGLVQVLEGSRVDALNEVREPSK